MIESINNKYTKIPDNSLIINIKIIDKTITIGMEIRITCHARPISAIFPAKEVSEIAELISCCILSEEGMQTGPIDVESYI